MTKRFSVSFITPLAAVVMLAVPASSRADDDDWSVPRTPDGKPDFEGVWANNNATPFERPDELADKAKLSDEEVAKLQASAQKFVNETDDAAFGDTVFKLALEGKESYESRDGETGNYNHFWVVEREFDNRTSLIVDPPNGKLPPMTDEAKARQQARAAYAKEHPADSYTDRSNSDRCITFGVPFMGAGYNGYFQVVQTPSHFVVMQEMAHEARIIPLDGRPHIEGDIKQWLGDSRGRWEGDSLVVETKNFSPKSRFFQSNENLHLIERYTRVGPDELRWEIGVADSTTWTEPWTAMIRLKKTDEPLFEYACHEGNYAMEGILAGQRAAETEGASTEGD